MIRKTSFFPNFAKRTHKPTYMKRLLLIIMTFLATSFVTPISSLAVNDIQAMEQEGKNVEIALQGNVLRVVGANGQEARIYNLAGVCVMAFKVEGNDRHYELNLRKGCYIVKVGTTARKVFVK